MKPIALHRTITNLATHYNLSYVVEQRITLAWKQFSDVCQKHNIQEVAPEDIVQIYRHWRSSSHSAENMKKRMGYLRRVLKFACAMGYIHRNPADLFVLPHISRKDPVSLPGDEIQSIRTARLFLPHLVLTRDAFLFQCYTGLAYIDVRNFNRECIATVEGKRYVLGMRHKKDAKFIFPLLPEALEILERYNYKIPVYSNARMNLYLKDIAEHAKVKTHLTTHVGRRTFGQIMLDKGVSIETVSKMLGHKSTATTEKFYARAGLQRIINEVGKMAA